MNEKRQRAVALCLFSLLGLGLTALFVKGGVAGVEVALVEAVLFFYTVFFVNSSRYAR